MERGILLAGIHSAQLNECAQKLLLQARTDPIACSGGMACLSFKVLREFLRPEIIFVHSFINSLGDAMLFVSSDCIGLYCREHHVVPRILRPFGEARSVRTHGKEGCRGARSSLGLGNVFV